MQLPASVAALIAALLGWPFDCAGPASGRNFATRTVAPERGHAYGKSPKTSSNAQASGGGRTATSSLARAGVAASAQCSGSRTPNLPDSLGSARHQSAHASAMNCARRTSRDQAKSPRDADKAREYSSGPVSESIASPRRTPLPRHARLPTAWRARARPTSTMRSTAEGSAASKEEEPAAGSPPMPCPDGGP